jgi:hypothetical protein
MYVACIKIIELLSIEPQLLKIIVFNEYDEIGIHPALRPLGLNSFMGSSPITHTGKLVPFKLLK